MKKDELKTIIGEGIGEASMLWNPRPPGIFESTKGCELTDRLTNKIYDLMTSDCKIQLKKLDKPQ